VTMAGELEKAFLKVETGDQIDCLFNPASLVIGRSNTWSANPGLGRTQGKASFLGMAPGTMSLSLTFDTTDTGQAVTIHTGRLLKLMDPDPSLPQSDETTGNVRPPTVTFHWGQNLTSYPAVITGLTTDFHYFASDGTPLRATVDLMLMQYEESDAFGPQNPTSGTPRPHRVHRVQPGETLDRISARYYGSSTKWRALAAANGIEDPLAVRPGTVLTVPRLGSD
jgi:LysM repeat protein